MMYNKSNFLGFKLFKYIIIFGFAICVDIMLVGLYYNKDKFTEIIEEVFQYEEYDEYDEYYDETEDEDDVMLCTVEAGYYLNGIVQTFTLTEDEQTEIGRYIDTITDGYSYAPYIAKHDYNYVINACGVNYYVARDINYISTDVNRFNYSSYKTRMYEILDNHFLRNNNVSFYVSSTNQSIELTNTDKANIIQLWNLENKISYNYSGLNINGEYSLNINNEVIYFDNFDSSFVKYNDNIISVSYKIQRILKNYVS